MLTLRVHLKDDMKSYDQCMEPQYELLKQFVDSIYVWKEGRGRFEFTAYPATSTFVVLLRNKVTRAHPDLRQF